MQEKRYYHIGFIDPKVVNCTNIHDKPAEIFKNLYKYLSVQHYKAYILFSYNFVSVLCRVTLLIMYNLIFLTLTRSGSYSYNLVVISGY